jgi:hypothetical protein
MATITADKVIGKSLYSKGSVDLVSLPGGKVLKTISSGGLLGNVYSWVTNNGIIYWQFYDTYGQPYYAKQDSNIDFPGLNDVLKQVENETIAKEIATKGALNYYLQKYLPWLIGGVVVALVLPTIIKLKTNEKEK